ncbi:hypothetical protein D3C71_2196360 [compost metagenome]
MLNDEAFAQADFFSQKNSDHDADGHKADAPDLNQKHDNDLPCYRKRGAGIDNDQAVHAYGGDGREQSIQ